jgi:hypothetical protein
MEPQSKTKICTQCKNDLPINEYYRDRTIYTKIAYRSKCKSCCTDNNKKRQQHDVNTAIAEKKCKTCNEAKDVSEYYISKRHTDGYFSECISCTEIKRKNKGNNPTFKRTPEYMVEYLNERKNDPNYKMKYVLRSNLTKAVCRIHGGTKSERTMKYVGCSLDFLKNWFEFLFDEHMNWSNHGSYWHIDHIKPCSSFDLTNQEDIFSCYNWSNLRPLNKEENIKKSNVLHCDLILYYKELKDAFLGQLDLNI